MFLTRKQACFKFRPIDYSITRLSVNEYFRPAPNKLNRSLPSGNIVTSGLSIDQSALSLTNWQKSSIIHCHIAFSNHFKFITMNNDGGYFRSGQFPIIQDGHPISLVYQTVYLMPYPDQKNC